MVVAPPTGSYLSRGVPGGHCRYPRTGVPLLLCLGKSLVVILNYALTADQPDPCGPEPYSPGKRPRTCSPLGEGPVTPHVPEEVALSQNIWGARTSQGVPDPPGPGSHILSGPLSREEQTPRLGLVRSRHMSVGARTRARPRGFPWKTRLPTVFNTVGERSPK